MTTSKPCDDKVCEEMDNLSLTQDLVSPNKSCVYEKQDTSIDEKNQCKGNTMVDDSNKLQHLPCYLPQSLSIKNMKKEIPLVTPLCSKRKQSMRRVTFRDKVEYINDKMMMNNTNKKRRTSPSYKPAPCAMDRAWRYDDDDVSYCSDT